MKPIFSITDYTIEKPKKPYPMHFYAESDGYSFPRIHGELHLSIVTGGAGTCSGVSCSACPLNADDDYIEESCNSIAKILSVIDHYLPNAKTLYPEFFI